MEIARGLVYLYLAVIPWSVVLISADLAGNDFARAAQVVLTSACTAALSVSQWRKSGQQPQLDWAHGLFFLLLFGMAGLSAIAAPEPAWAWRELALFAGLLAVVQVVADSYTDRRGELLCQVAAVSFGFFCLLQWLVAVGAMVEGQALIPSEFFLGYSHRRFFNHTATIAMPLCALAITVGRMKLIRLAGWWGLVAGTALVLFSGGRAAILSQVLAVIVVWAFLGARAGQLLRTTALGLLLGVVLYALQFRWLPEYLGLLEPLDLAGRAGDMGSVASRIVLWDLAFQHWRSSPLLGMGPMHFAHYPNVDAAHPHNIYVQLITEWGVLFGVSALGLAALAYRCLLQRVRMMAPEAPMAAGLLMCVTAIAGDGVFSGNFVMPVSQTWIAVVLGWSLGWMRYSRASLVDGSGSDKRSILQSAAQVGLSLITLSVAVWLSVTVIDDIQHLADLRAQSARLSTENPHACRFWCDGWF